MIRLPRLSPNALRQIAACIHFDLPDYPELGALFQRHSGMNVAKIIGQDDDIFARRIIETYDEVAHYHVEASVGRALGVMLFGKLDKAKDVLSSIRELEGRQFSATVWGRRAVPRKSLPPRGIISALSEVSTRTAGYKMTLNGGTLELDGKGPFFEVKWFDSTEASVIIEVSAFLEAIVNDDLLISAASKVQEGIDLLVLEKPRPKKRRKHEPDKQD